MPLLGLEPTTTENIEERDPKSVTDSFESSLNPLLGTNILKTNTKSSQTRSSDRVCYGSLLRFGAQRSGLNLREREGNSPRGCYGFSHGLLPRGMMLRGGRFYLRRHVPTDIQPIIGRVEVWRSLKTDSLQTALRRLPLITATLESEFERIRHDAGLTVVLQSRRVFH